MPTSMSTSPSNASTILDIHLFIINIHLSHRETGYSLLGSTQCLLMVSRPVVGLRGQYGQKINKIEDPFGYFFMWVAHAIAQYQRRHGVPAHTAPLRPVVNRLTAVLSDCTEFKAEQSRITAAPHHI